MLRCRRLDFTLGVLLGAFAVGGSAWLPRVFAPSESLELERLTVERIDVVETDGTLRLVISNEARQTMGAVDGKDLPQRQRDAGLIFFNDRGDEMGGLVFGGDEQRAGGIFTFDQFRNDQVLGLMSSERSPGDMDLRQTGLVLWDRPVGESIWDSLETQERVAAMDAQDREAEIAALVEDELYSAQRMFVGRNRDGEVGLELHDRQGRVRLRVMTSKDGEPRIEFLDENGGIVRAVTAE